MIRWAPRPEYPTVISGADVLAFRQRFGWTQQDLAVALGCGRSTICRWELGHRNPQGAVALALAYLADAMTIPSNHGK